MALSLLITALEGRGGGLQVEGQLGLHCKFLTNQAYMVKLCLKKVCVSLCVCAGVSSMVTLAFNPSTIGKGACHHA